MASGKNLTMYKESVDSSPDYENNPLTGILKFSVSLKTI